MLLGDIHAITLESRGTLGIKTLLFTVTLDMCPPVTTSHKQTTPNRIRCDKYYIHI